MQYPRILLELIILRSKSFPFPHSTAGSRAAAAAYGGGRNQYSTMPIMGGGSGNGGGAGSVDKLVLEAGVNHDNSGMNFYQTTTLSTFSKRGTELRLHIGQ